MTTIKLPQLSYDGFKVIKGSPIILEFHEQYVKYSAWSDNIYRDPETSLDSEKHFENISFVDKNLISSIDLSWCTQYEHYDIVVRHGSDEYLCVKLPEKDQAFLLQQQFVDWKYKGVMPEMKGDKK